MGLTAFVFSLGAVVLAEMGDKTQLLAMAFATKYKATNSNIFFTPLSHKKDLSIWVGHFYDIHCGIRSLMSTIFLYM